MTIKELQALLSTCPPDAAVFLAVGDNPHEIEGVAARQDGTKVLVIAVFDEDEAADK